MARDKIFISYRRDDAAADARSIYQHLVGRFGKRALFMDVDSIAPGRDFREVLAESLARTRVLLVLIGPRWNAGGRLSDAHDFVRLEVREALKAGIAVTPVLLNDAPLPTAAELPEDVQPLVYRHALRVRHESFGSDMAALERAVRPSGGFGVARIALAAALVGGLGYGYSAGVFDGLWPEPERRPPVAVAPTPAPPVVAAPARPARPAISTTPGAAFREPGCPQCPELVVMPSGSFMMGSPDDEPERDDDEGPRRRVSVKSFAIGVYEVTFDEWAACVTDGFCRSNPSPSDEGWGKANRPVINVSWDDITGRRGFIDWLNSKTTGAPYRLPSEAEWEYAARAGSDTPFWWGRTITPEQANYNGNYSYNGGSKGAYRQKTLPVRSFQPNKFGLYQVHGNVWEWVQDCWNPSLDGQPADGSARKSGDCSQAGLRGGSWDDSAHWLRSAFRGRFLRSNRNGLIGFRVARTAVE